MDKPNDKNFDDDDSLTEEEFENLRELLDNPATATRTYTKLRQFTYRCLMSNDGDNKLKSLGRRVSVEEIADSAMGSLIRAADKYQDKSGAELRAIFWTIVHRKKIDKHEFHRRPRRDLCKEEYATEKDKQQGKRPISSDNPKRIRKKKNARQDSDSDETQAGHAEMSVPVERSDQEQFLEFVQGASGEQMALFRETIEQLPIYLREVARLILSRFTDEEIAKIIGCSRRTVTRRHIELKQKLREILEDDGLS